MILLNLSKNMSILALLLLLSALTLMLNEAPIASASTIVVPNDYSTPQDAINRASPGDTIMIRAGSYGGFTVSKSLVIVGESNQSVVINGSVEIVANDVRIGSIKIKLSDASASSVALRIRGNNTVLVGIIIDSYKNGVQIGDVDHTVAGATIEYSRIVAGDLCIFGSYRNLDVFYSEISSKNGTAIVGGNALDLEFNSINGDTAVSSSLFSEGYVIKNNSITGKSTGLYLDGSYHTVSGNSITGGTGIVLKGKGINVYNNIIRASGTGVLIVSQNNLVIGNWISASERAIDLNGNSNVISNNTLSGGRGVHANGAYGNVIAFNFINMTGSVGVYLSSYTSDNLVYGNTFWYCYNYEAADESGKNQWYLENQTHRLGNYWSYNKASDSNGDGITDQPYRISTTTGLDILDKYPLAKPIVGLSQSTSTTTISTTTKTQTTTSTQTATRTITNTQTTSQNFTMSTGSYTNTSTNVGGEGIGANYAAILGAAVALIMVAIVMVMLRRR